MLRFALHDVPTAYRQPITNRSSIFVIEIITKKMRWPGTQPNHLNNYRNSQLASWASK